MDSVQNVSDINKLMTGYKLDVNVNPIAKGKHLCINNLFFV